jgi:hypothetical protein
MNDSARYERGLARFLEIYGEQAKGFLASLDEIAPDLGAYVVEFAFGDIHCRPGLQLSLNSEVGGGFMVFSMAIFGSGCSFRMQLRRS